MSNPNSILIAASPEFAALCESQMALLHQALGANWSGVYLTSRLDEESETKLVPLILYPQTDQWELKNNSVMALPKFSPRLESKSPLMLAPSARKINQQKKDTSIRKQDNLIEQKQIVLPLIYQEIVMGLLVTRRKDREWNAKELTHIEKIAETLAIARFLDQRQEWYQQQLTEINNLRTREDNQIHDLLHQLRNPLTALRTFSKLLLKRLLPEDRNQKVAEGILRESDRLQELLQQFEGEINQDNSLLLVNEAQANNSNFLLPGNSLNSKNITIQEVLEPLLISAEAIAQEKEIDLTVNIPSNLPTVKANPQALREVFSNLIDNAIKYTPIAGKVKIEFPSKKQYQGISISDSGYGIPPESQTHIFQRYYRGIQAESDIPGTGLGLAIAKELVEEMQGEIELISPNELGNNNSVGTTFVVWLPLS